MQSEEWRIASQHLLYCTFNAVGIVSAESLQLSHGALLDEVVVDAERADTCRETVFAQEFGDGLAHTSAQYSVLDRKDAVEASAYLAQQLAVERLGEAQVVVCYGYQTAALDTAYGLGGGIARCAVVTTAMLLPSFSRRPRPVGMDSKVAPRHSTPSPQPRG